MQPCTSTCSLAGPEDPHNAMVRRRSYARSTPKPLPYARREDDPTMHQAFDPQAQRDWPVATVASFVKVNTHVIYIAKTRTLQRLRETVRQPAA